MDDIADIEWIYFEDHKPETSGFYMVCLDGDDISTYGYYDAAVGDWFTHFINGECLGCVNYWMSFLTAPEDNF